MYYEITLKDHIRVAPELFGLKTEEAITKEIRKKYDGFISEELGIVVDVLGVDEVGEGIIVPGDGASYFDTTFKIMSFKPELQEVLPGRIRDLADFGAFITLGPIDGMIHISQTMDDFVSFSKEKVLTGKETNRNLKVNDLCLARMIAVSYKDPTNPKLGLTMRQDRLGKPEWWENEAKSK